MTYRGHIRNGAVVLDDPPVDLPEGAAVEVNVVVADSSIPPQRPPITSLEELRSKLPGDPFDGADPADMLRELRSHPWRASAQEPLE
jgi:hypothetical protein